MTTPDVSVSTQAYNPEKDQTSTTVQAGKVETNVQVEPTNRTAAEEAHREAMIKKADEGTANHDASDDLFAGKYKSEEEYHKAIIHAFKKKHGDKHEEAFNQLTGDLSGSSDSDNDDSGSPKAESDPQTNADPNVAQTDNTQQEGNTEGDAEGDTGENTEFNMDKFVNEFVETETISEESYGELEAQGIDRSMADTYMEGVKAQRDSLFSIVGGKDNFFEMTTWAAEDNGMSDADIALFNSELNSGDMSKMRRAVTMLKTQFTAAGLQTAPATKLEATHTSTSNVVGYTDVSDLKLDQANPLYKTSAAFRAQVKEKLRRGTI